MIGIVVTYIIGPYIIIYPLAVIHWILTWNIIKLLNHWPARVVVIDLCTEFRYRICIHVRIMPETVTYLCQLTILMISHQLLLPWCTTITGYWISSNNSIHQQQPTTGYRQTSKLLLGTSQPTRVKTSKNRIYTW